eukprot:Skav206928  [mRNA]  locus=scaffold1731:107996:116206:- [translate_table: standard]
MQRIRSACSTALAKTCEPVGMNMLLRSWGPRKSYSQFVLLDDELAATCRLQRLPLPEKSVIGFRQMFNIGNFNESLVRKAKFFSIEWRASGVEKLVHSEHYGSVLFKNLCVRVTALKLRKRQQGLNAYLANLGCQAQAVPMQGLGMGMTTSQSSGPCGSQCGTQTMRHENCRM